MDGSGQKSGKGPRSLCGFHPCCERQAGMHGTLSYLKYRRSNGNDGKSMASLADISVV